MGLTESQWWAISALKPATETRIPTYEDQRPSSIYLSDERFDAEMRELFRKVPLVLAPSAFLPEPNMSVAHDGYGVPILLTRDRNGVARAFINACRHRGSKLVESCEPVKGGRVSCPYHAWTYGLDGALVGIPRHDTFPSLNKADLPLIPLTTHENGGLIWVGIDHTASPAMIEGSDELCADMDAFGIGNMHVYGRRTYDLKTNWKLAMEPFLEPYHIQRLHAASVAPMFADVPNVVTRFGHHIRQCSGKAHFDPALLEGNVDNLHKHITHAYLMFPNTVFITSPYYMSLMVLIPRAKNRTIVDYYMLVRSAPDNPKAEDLYERSYEMIHNVFYGEDFRAATIQNEALESQAIPAVHFGGLEEMIGPFHESIESYLPR
jgi:phenylpropionate dioxygenase-like ring-hydroxylating dioxygenase large terminal subunit